MTRKKKKLFAVEHTLGQSLFKAKTPAHALKIARSHFGAYGGPYRLAQNQSEALAWCSAMNARVIEEGD